MTEFIYNKELMEEADIFSSGGGQHFCERHDVDYDALQAWVETTDWTARITRLMAERNYSPDKAIQVVASAAFGLGFQRGVETSYLLQLRNIEIPCNYEQ